MASGMAGRASVAPALCFGSWLNMSPFIGVIGLATFFAVAIGSGQRAVSETLQLVVSGQPRSLVLERPADQTPRPTIILLHGLNGAGAVVGRRTGLDRLAPQSGYSAVFPDGLSNRWNHFLPGKEPPLF